MMHRLGLLFTIANAATVHAATLTGYYPLDEVFGTKLTNVVAGSAASITNLMFAGPGMTGNAMRFAETSSSAINLDTSNMVLSILKQ